jgi:hypothetical protein
MTADFRVVQSRDILRCGIRLSAKRRASKSVESATVGGESERRFDSLPPGQHVSYRIDDVNRRTRKRTPVRKRSKLVDRN